PFTFSTIVSGLIEDVVSCTVGQAAQYNAPGLYLLLGQINDSYSLQRITGDVGNLDSCDASDRRNIYGQLTVIRRQLGGFCNRWWYLNAIDEYHLSGNASICSRFSSGVRLVTHPEIADRQHTITRHA